MGLIDSESNLLKIFHVKICINWDKDKVIILESWKQQINMLMITIIMEREKEHINERYKEYAQKPEVKERIKEYKKEYDRKPEVIEKKIHYKKDYNTKPENIEKRKEYRQKPEIKERENNRKSEIIICECGCSLRRDSISRHQKTKVHFNFITQQQ